MSLSIVDYSERAIALFGETKPYKNKITDLGGKFNPSLKVSNSEERRAGWIFPKTKKSVVEQMVNDIISGNIQAEVTDEKTTYTKSTSVSKNITQQSTVEISRTDFMNLLSKVERLEQEVNNLKLLLSGNSSSSSNNINNSNKKIVNEDFDEEELNEEEEKPKKRLLRKK
jgi:hypothetical protein